MTLVPTRWWASFFMPSCLLLLALAIGIAWCLWAWKRGRTTRPARLPEAWTIGSLVLLYLASAPAVARWAAWTLEREYPPVAVERLPAADAIVVLGGAMHLPRAAEHYRRLGFTVTALPSDFATQGEAERWSWALLIPRAAALAQVDDVAKEWMGWMLQRSRT